MEPRPPKSALLCLPAALLMISIYWALTLFPSPPTDPTLAETEIVAGCMRARHEYTKPIHPIIRTRPTINATVQHPLVFVHIPKTGGTTVSKYLEKNWIDHAGCSLVRRGNDGRPVEKLRKRLEESPGQCLIAIAWKKFVPPQELISWVTDSRIPIRYEHGHHPIGLCSFLDPGCHYTTVLREPVDRTISHYYYLRTLPESFAPFVKILNTQLDTLDKFLDAVQEGRFSHYGLFNMHTLLLSGDGFFEYANNYLLCPRHRQGCDVNPNSISWAHVQLAKRNLLRNFPIIGLTHRLPEYGALMYVKYGYPFVESLCTQENKNTHASRNETFTLQHYTRIRHLNRFDVVLYDFAEQIFQAQIEEAGDAFKQALEMIRRNCSLSFAPNTTRRADKGGME